MASSEQLGKLKDNKYFNRAAEAVKDNTYFVAAGFVFLLALYLRYIPEQGMQYLQALDPYMIFRMSQHLALEGNLPAMDFMRYFPYQTPVYSLNLGDIIFPALMYWAGPVLFFGSFLEWAQFYPAFMGALGVLVMYFIGKEYFNKTAGLSAAFFLATIAGAMHRTSAGFFEKEPLGSFFMLVSIYFFGRAWKREDWKSGIVSGLALGFFTISWGGSRMMWLLYPLVVGLMLWINEDIRKLVVAYTPTVILGGVVAATLNSSRFWFTDSLFILNIGMMGFLWSRYLVEELELIDKQQLPYYTPGMSILGTIALVLSPLYSDFLAAKMMAAVRTVTQSTGDVVAGTVAENAPASLSQISSQLGAVGAGNAYYFLDGILQSIAAALGMPMALLANLVGPWPLAYLGIVFMTTTVSAMLLRKLDFFEKDIAGLTYYKILLTVGLAWTFVFSAVFTDPVAYIAGPSLLALFGGAALLYSLEEMPEISIEYRWYMLLPLAWIVTNILGAVSMSRLVFLATFPASLGAGYMLSKIIYRLKNISQESAFYIGATSAILLVDIAIIIGLSSVMSVTLAAVVVVALNGLGLVYFPEEKIDGIEEYVDMSYFRPGIIVALVLVVLTVNAASGYSSANQLGGSPNNLWIDNLEYMENQTPEGSVILSWWDYGYWFESIGRRAAVADGGNLAYYSGKDPKINYPLADYLTSKNQSDTSFLEKHSVDYIVLDKSMMDKYSAVSQIAHRSNSQFNSMLRMSTSRDIRQSMSQSNNRTIVQFSRNRYFTMYVPVDVNRQTGAIDITSAPTMELGGTRGPVDCVLTENGRKTFEVSEQPIRLQGFGEVCAATDPYYSIERSFFSVNSDRMRPTQAEALLVPKNIADTNLVRLYLMDGYGVPYVEKVEEGSNRYVKMWKVSGTN